MHGYPDLGQPPQAEAEDELPFEIAARERLRALPVHHVLDEVDAIDAAVADRHVDADRDRRGQRERQSERHALHAHLARRFGEVVAKAGREEVNDEGYEWAHCFPIVVWGFFLFFVYFCG